MQSDRGRDDRYEGVKHDCGNPEQLLLNNATILNANCSVSVHLKRRRIVMMQKRAENGQRHYANRGAETRIKGKKVLDH